MNKSSFVVLRNLVKKAETKKFKNHSIPVLPSRSVGLPEVGYRIFAVELVTQFSSTVTVGLGATGETKKMCC